MRSTDERIAAVGRRTKALKQRQKLRRSGIAAGCTIAAAVALVLGLGLAMPGIMAEMQTLRHLGASEMASLFSAGSGGGYVLIALLAFALGVCITLLCIHLHRGAKKSDPTEENEKASDD